MNSEERNLRRALEARSGEPSAEYRARLASALGAGRPASRATPQLAVLAAVFLAVAMVAVLVLARHGAHLTPPPGPATGPRVHSTPTPPSTTFDSITMFGDSGWGVVGASSGPPSSLFHTTDGGTAWTNVTPTIAAGHFISGFAPVDANRAWTIAPSSAGGSAPADLFGTRDGGQTWARTTAPAVAYRSPVIVFVDDTHGWLATPGEPGSQFTEQGIVIDRTVDGGKTWRLVAQTDVQAGHSTPGAPSASCGKDDIAFLDANVGWLTGGCTGGITFDVTNDGGVTWKAQVLPGPAGLSALKACEGGPCVLSAPRFASRGFGYMVLHDTSLSPVRSWFYESRDNGKSWTVHALPGQETRVVMLNASVGFASVGVTVDKADAVVPNATWLYRTDDGGASWHVIPTNVQLSFAAISCVSASRCWAVSPSLAGGDPSTRMYLTTDGGRTWNPRVLG